MIFPGHCVVRAGVAFLMAVAMPLSGLPHFDCVCPDGHRKAFCSGRCSSDTGCCCAGSCCPSAQGGKCCCRVRESSQPGSAGSGCCKHKTQQLPSPQAPNSESQLSGGCCHLTLVQAEPPGVFLAGEKVIPHPTDGLSAPLCQAPFVSLVSSGRGPFSGRSCQRPPPTDLVITLCHLTI